MKLVNHRTDTLIIRAGSNSEWDGCSYAIIDVSDGYLERLNAIADTVSTTVGKIDGLLNVSFLDSNVEFFVDIPEELQLTAEQVWAFIEDFDAEDAFTWPESPLECHQVRVGRIGGVYWLAYGKYTSEEYFSESINIFDLITIK